MIYALTAAPQRLTDVFVGDYDGGKLFITGYSQGGYVALANAAGDAALACGSDGDRADVRPYALSAFGDAVVLRRCRYRRADFATFLVSSYQHATATSTRISRYLRTEICHRHRFHCCR